MVVYVRKPLGKFVSHSLAACDQGLKDSRGMVDLGELRCALKQSPWR